jgi:hypothetical protein
VDKPLDSVALVTRLGLTLTLASDPTQTVVKAFRVQNPDTQELGLHAVYVVDEHSKVIYRKVARRRPVSNELIDAVDAYYGTYPQQDRAERAQPINVAYPLNNFQALLESSSVQGLPSTINVNDFSVVLDLAREIHSDDALIALRLFMEANAHLKTDDLLQTVNWLTQQIYFPDDHTPLETGRQLSQRLGQVNELETKLNNTTEAEARDKLLDELQKARALLTRTRAVISNNASEWRLRLLKTSIRSYREVVHAAKRNQQAAKLDI